MRELTAAVGEVAEAKRAANDQVVAVWGFDAHLARAIARIDEIRARSSTRGTRGR